MQAILDHAATLVIDDADWEPGAWTSARCALWNSINEGQRKWLFDWIEAEKSSRVCRENQLPRVSQRNHTAAE